MSLRRVSEHVSAQNWFAMSLNFVIVVAGVFLGIQVGNWNEERIFDDQERILLDEPRTEITEGAEMAGLWRSYLG